MTIYIDTEYKCHLTDDGTMTAVETDYFDGYCAKYIEGYCYIPDQGKLFPWKPFAELDAAQRAHEKERLADAENALAILYGGAL